MNRLHTGADGVAFDEHVWIWRDATWLGVRFRKREIRAFIDWVKEK